MGLKVYTKEFHVSTSRRFQAVRITDKVLEILRESGIKNGLLTVFLPHATAAIVANEFEPRIASDYLEWVKRYVPPDAPWRHNDIDDNAHAHIASAIIGPSRTFPVVNGSLIRGTWQEIILLEFDGPRHRRVVVQIIGE